MNNKSKEFKELQDKWYKKLKKTGFDDLENSKEQLRNGANNNAVTWSKIRDFSSREEYYRIAGQFLYEFEFKSSFDKKVWASHCEGIAIRNTAKTLKSYRDKVSKSIIKTRTEMLNKYKKDQEDDQ